MINLEIATLGGGCFWCVEAVYKSVRGIEKIRPGYSGGKRETADYKTVCTGKTDHAEVVQLFFDPKIISYEEIIEMFWTAHDPTTLNRQGNDRGPQYRSVVFYHNEEQKAIVEKSIKEVASKLYDDPVVTQVVPFKQFFHAELYHLDYYAKVGDRNPYCAYVITPKVNKFRKKYADRLKIGA